jgi:RNA polymerase sigma factor (TIGR02999 family)
MKAILPSYHDTMDDGDKADGPDHRVTAALGQLRSGNRQAAADLLPLVYDELRRLAARAFESQPADHTMQPTALVHEAYLRLVRNGDQGWHDRTHFYAVAATAMRQILVNHAHRRHAGKRGGGGRRVPLEGVIPATADRDELVLALDEALQALGAIDPQCARVVELRFFGGMTIEQAATVLGISPRSVNRAWNFARGWLYREMTRGE